MFGPLLIFSIVGCGIFDHGPRPINDLGGEFFDAPWPSDLRRAAAGGLDLSGFPNLEQIPLLADYAAVGAEALDGAGTNAPIYFRFDGPLDTEALPDPMGSLEPGATLFLVDVDPTSPARGQPHPIHWRFNEDETEYQAANLLSMAPLPGYPLRPGTTYAAVVTTQVARQDPTLAAAWSPESADNSDWVPLQETLFELGVAVEEIAIASVFTTQDPVGEMALYADRVHSLEVTALDQPLHRAEAFLDWEGWEGGLFLPLWQHGDKPYNEGGAFEREADGSPAMADWELTRFSLSLPASGEAPASGWPVVIYSHGTGGDHLTCCNSDSSLEPAQVMADAGFAVFAISQPLHGDRGTDDTIVTWHSFNYSNLDAARATFRQSALDLVYVAHLLSGRAQTFELEGDEVTIDPNRVFFMGHSQGGITGAIAAPYFDGDVRAAVFSGAGGHLGLSLVYRDDPVYGDQSAADLVMELLEFDDGEVLDDLHPVAAVVQALGEVTDPLNYSPYWFRLDSGGAPLHVLVTEGLHDEQTPFQTTEALAAAAGVPVLDPAVSVSEALTLRDPETQSLPAQGNVTGWDGSAITAGLSQYPDQDHYAVFQDPDAAALYQAFFESGLDGEPTLGD